MTYDLSALGEKFGLQRGFRKKFLKKNKKNGENLQKVLDIHKKVCYNGYINRKCDKEKTRGSTWILEK